LQLKCESVFNSRLLKKERALLQERNPRNLLIISDLEESESVASSVVSGHNMTGFAGESSQHCRYKSLHFKYTIADSLADSAKMPIQKGIRPRRGAGDRGILTRQLFSSEKDVGVEGGEPLTS
jgi:hypothetical protein